MKIGKFIAGVGIGTVIGMLLAPKKGSELRQDLKDKSHELYDKAQNMTKEDIETLVNNTIEEIKQAIEEFDLDEFKEATGAKLSNSIKSSDEYANFKEAVNKVSTDLTSTISEIKTKIQDKDFDAIQKLDDAMDDIEDELDIIIEDLKD